MFHLLRGVLASSLLSLVWVEASFALPSCHTEAKGQSSNSSISISSSIVSTTTTLSIPASPSPDPNSVQPSSSSKSCFPAEGFKMPSSPPSDNKHWWCNMADEYAFVGFSYEVTACQSLHQLQKEFRDMRQEFHSRYVRLYGACDRKGFYDDIVEAAWNNTLGVHALVWFGFDDSDIWKKRRDTLFASLHNNPKAKFVTRGVQFGSEPLFDGVLNPEDLTKQVKAAKANLSSLNIPVTVSEMAYGYQKNGGAQEVLDAQDFINIHMLPFFAQDASTADKAWPIVERDLNWFASHAKGKKMFFDENGWPSVTSAKAGVQPNSPSAVADVKNEHAYYSLLDNHCADLKKVAGGGIGWFAHIYSDDEEPGYGIKDNSGQSKFSFKPKTSC